MNETVLVSLLGFSGTLFGSLFGILAAQKLLNHRVARLEGVSDEHEKEINSVSQKVTKLEGRVTEAEHDIRDLKAYHKPGH